MPMRQILFALAIVMGCASSVMAGDCEAPCLTSTLTLEVQDDWTFASSDGAFDRNILLPAFEAESIFELSENLSVVSVSRLEQVVEPEPGQNSTFENLGLYTGELYVQWSSDPLTFRIGKFEPTFSYASAAGEGVHATDLAGNADMDESLGLTAALEFETADVSHRVTASAFTMDRSFLSGSLFTKREVLKLSDGGAGNTTGLSSFSAVLDSCSGAAVEDCHDEGDLGVHIGARFQRAGAQTGEQADEDIAPQSELAFFAAADGTMAAGEATLHWLGEISYLRHFEGNPGDAVIATALAALETGPVTWSLGLSRQWNLLPDAAHTHADVAELALHYKPESGPWSMAGGYSYARNDESAIEHMLSLRLKFAWTDSMAF